MASPHSFCCSSRAEGVGWWSRLVPPSMDWAATALLCAAAATVITLVHIYHHLLHYAEPIYQRFIVRLIFMAPDFPNLKIVNQFYLQESAETSSGTDHVVSEYFCEDHVSIAGIWCCHPSKKPLILEDVFMGAYHTVFNFGKDRIGFAKSA